MNKKDYNKNSPMNHIDYSDLCELAKLLKVDRMKYVTLKVGRLYRTTSLTTFLKKVKEFKKKYPQCTNISILEYGPTLCGEVPFDKGELIKQIKKEYNNLELLKKHDEEFKKRNETRDRALYEQLKKRFF